MKQQFGLYEVYFDRLARIWKSKRLKAGKDPVVLLDEARQLKESHKNDKGLDFVVNRAGWRINA